MRLWKAWDKLTSSSLFTEVVLGVLLVIIAVALMFVWQEFGVQKFGV